MKEVVSFFLSGKEYGVEVSHMQGVENYAELTHTAQAQERLLGIINIRDELIPVMDIKKRLVLPPAGVTADTKYLVFRTSHGKLACVADGIADIFQVDGENVQSFPSIMKTESTDYADFVAKRKNGLVIVINPENLLSAEDWKAVGEMIDKMEDKDD